MMAVKWVVSKAVMLVVERVGMKVVRKVCRMADPRAELSADLLVDKKAV